MILKSTITILLLTISTSIYAQTTRKYSNEFLSIGVDAAAFGMGNAVVSSTNNVNAGYWNPAGLIHLDNKQLGIMHTSYFANIANYDYIAFGMPLDAESAVGISVIRFAIDDILDTTQLIDDQGNINYNRINLFSTADYGVTFSYARQLKNTGLNYGANAKIIRRIIGDFASSWGFGLDIGAQYSTTKNWNFGIMARDITTTFNTWQFNDDKINQIKTAIDGQNQELPEQTEITIPKLQLGVSKKIAFKNKLSLRPELDMNIRFTETNDIISSSFASINPSFGFELDYNSIVFLRGGTRNFQNELQLDNTTKLGFQPSLGAGFKYKGIAIDYAFTDIGDQSVALYSNVFSLLIDFSIFDKSSKTSLN